MATILIALITGIIRITLGALALMWGLTYIHTHGTDIGYMGCAYLVVLLGMLVTCLQEWE